MFNLLRKDLPAAGSVHYRGNIPPRAEEFEYLRMQGVELAREETSGNVHWHLKLRHREWGEADLVCLRDMPPVPASLVDLSATLSDTEKEEAKSGGPGVTVRLQGKKKNVLRDRKHLLRYLRAVMGDDGVAAADHNSQRFWSRAQLDEELAHDADLDIESLTSFHAVTEDAEPCASTSQEEDEGPPVRWLHSHGLAELGAFDYDILRPGPDAVSMRGNDCLRAVSLAILEGKLAPETTGLLLGMPGPVVRTVTAETFQRTASPEDAALRDHDESHSTHRSVICEPQRGLFARFRSRPRPSKFFSAPFPEQLMVMFTDAATGLMAERARATAGVFRMLCKEFARHEFPTIVKLGIEVDGGGSNEHMWFEVHDIDEATVDATLTNQPFHVSALKQGDRGRHSLERLTDWTIITPVGQINPRDQSPARLIREHPEMLSMMKMLMGLDGPPE